MDAAKAALKEKIMKNVYVIGAGANNEIKMPTGVDLKSKISQIMNFSFEFGSLIAGNYIILNCIEQEAKADKTEIGKYLQAARSIHDALPQAISIDNFLDAHRNNQYIDFCGKLGIVYCILEAEKSCLLYTEGNQKLNFKVSEKTWYHTFFQILTENCRREELTKRLQDIGFIIFNYDRCFENYILKALQNYYLISEQDASIIVSSMNIIHPYGSVGILPFQNEGIKVSFGYTPDSTILVNLAHQINTFTEWQNSNSLTNKINLEKYFIDVDKTVFLGFAFHNLNMKLMFDNTRAFYQNNPRRVSCFGSAYNISPNDIEVVKNMLFQAFGDRINFNLIDNKCYEFINHFWRSLSFSSFI